MRRTITISVSEEMRDYILGESGYGTVSEYIRSLIKREQQRRADNRARPLPTTARANDCNTFADALKLLDALKDVLERRNRYDD